MSRFEAGLDGVTFTSQGCRLLGGFYRGAGDGPRPTAVLLHGLPGIEKHLDVAYRLRDVGWNCLYFHFRGCWGSEGAFSLAGLADDTRAAVEWVRTQPCVHADRMVLIGASTGSHPAFVLGAAEPRIRAVVGVSPLVDPRAFRFPTDMAGAFANMLSGVTGPDLLKQWDELGPLADAVRALSSRDLLLVTADHDEIFPASDYEHVITALPDVRWIRHPTGDHGFSACRPWLVQTVTDWLIATVGT